MGNIVEIVNKYGFPIVMAVGMGVIIKYVWTWATTEIKPVINDANGVLTVEVKDYYSKITATSELPYSLTKTVASYFNLNRNEMVVEYATKN